MAARKRVRKIGVQDLGGDEAGRIDRHEHAPTLVERRIDAMMMLMRDSKRRLWVTDENRRTIESMTPGEYEASGYYQRWLHALRSLLIEKDVLSKQDIDKRLREVRLRHGAKESRRKAPKSIAKRSRKAVEAGKVR